MFRATLGAHWLFTARRITGDDDDDNDTYNDVMMMITGGSLPASSAGASGVQSPTFPVSAPGQFFFSFFFPATFAT